MTARAAPSVFPPAGDNFVTLPKHVLEIEAFTNTLAYCFERIAQDEAKRHAEARKKKRRAISLSVTWT